MTWRLRAEKSSDWALLLGLALLFLEAAGTVDVGYTITPSYALFLVACGVGLPSVARGWVRVPRELLVAAAFLLLTYLAAFAFGSSRSIDSLSRANPHRDLAYLADLMLGLGLVGLCVDVSRRLGSARRLIYAVGAGALAASLYGLYQWFAQRFGLPASDVNNAINTTGLSFGAVGSQGTGLLGWERIRGTFIEPQYLAAFLASTVFFVLALVSRQRPQTRIVVVSVVIAAAVLTSSAPGLGTMLVGALAGGLVLMIARGNVRMSAAVGGTLAVVIAAGALVLADPSSVGSVTGRSGSDLVLTTQFRTDSWSRASEQWARRPILGFGPGQTSVQLAAPAKSIAAVGLKSPPIVLGSAHGLWAASLVDAGILGFVAWIAVLGGLLWWGGAVILRTRSPSLAITFAAANTAVSGALIAGDRLEPRIWAVLALLVAGTSCASTQQNGEGDAQTS